VSFSESEGGEMSRVPSVVWIILAVLVALILFFWLLPMIFGGRNFNGSAFLLANMRR